MRCRARTRRILTTLGACAVVLAAAEKNPPVSIPLAWPPAGAAYKVQYLDSISSPADLSIRRGLFGRLGDLLLGPSEQPRKLFRPFTIAVDRQGRLLVTDPGARAAHLLDPGKKKHKILRGPSRQPLESPIGGDFDSAGNVYVADSALGKIFVFDNEGRFRRFIGDAKGEGIFKRPTGLTVDRTTDRIYLTDTLRHKVHVLDFEGRLEREWGQRGTGAGEFNFPTAVALAGDRVLVLDAMNFRVQVFTRAGAYVSSFGRLANEPGGFFRPKGLAVDARLGLVYVVDSMFEAVQAFTLGGELVLAVGHPGSGPGEFRLPAGVCVQPDGRVLVADSYNRRIQVLQAVSEGTATPGGSE